MPEQPTLVQLVDGRYYSLPDARAYVCLVPPVDGRNACIRLRLLNATTMDVPMSAEDLTVLAHDLRPYLPAD
jgi:hypothetical protein